MSASAPAPRAEYEVSFLAISEQYDLYIQGVGWPDHSMTLVRRPLVNGSALVLGTKAGLVTSALGINAQRDLAAVRRLIERKIAVDVSHLADPGRPFWRNAEGQSIVKHDQARAIYLTADGSVILQGTAVDVDQRDIDQRKELHLPLDGGLIHVDRNLVRAIKEML